MTLRATPDATLLNTLDYPAILTLDASQVFNCLTIDDSQHVTLATDVTDTHVQTTTCVKRGMGATAIQLPITGTSLTVEDGTLMLADADFTQADISGAGATFQADKFGTSLIQYVRLTVTAVNMADNAPAISELRLFRAGVPVQWPVGTRLTDSTGATVTTTTATYPGPVGSNNEGLGALIDGYFGMSAASAGYASGAINRNKWWPNSVSTAPWTVTIAFPLPVSAFDAVNLCAADYAPRHPTAWTVETSVDGALWTTVASTSGVSCVANSWFGTGALDPYFSCHAPATHAVTVSEHATLIGSGEYVASTLSFEDGASFIATTNMLTLALGSTLEVPSVNLILGDGFPIPGTNYFIRADTRTGTWPDAADFVVAPTTSAVEVVRLPDGYALVSPERELVSPFCATSMADATWTELLWHDAKGIALDSSFMWRARTNDTAILSNTAPASVSLATPVALAQLTTIATQVLRVTGDAQSSFATLDDRASTATTIFDFPLASARVLAGVDTRLPHAGTGALTIGATCSITATNTWAIGDYSGAGRFVLDAPGAVLAAAPRQANFTGTFVVTNGTVVYSATGVYPLKSAVEVCGAGAMLLFTNALDISGYETPNANKRLTLRDGGTLRLAMRDTFSCPMILDNGGRVIMNADVLNANRAFDFFTGSSLRATGVATNVIAGGRIAIRRNNFSVTVDDGATLDVQAQWGSDSADNSLGFTWTKAGSGTLIFHRASPQTGAVTIAAGTVRLEADATLCNATATFANGTTFDLSAKSTPIAQAMNVAANAVVTIAVYGRGVAAGDRLITWNTPPAGRFVLRGAPGFTVRKTNTGLVVIPQGLTLILR